MARRRKSPRRDRLKDEKGAIRLALTPLKKNITLADKAYQVIRDAIVSSQFAPNDVLTEEKLCAELSISRTPIRTALHRLVEDGLAEVRGKSIVVSPLTEDDIANISFVRQSVELLVMEQLRGKATPALIRALRNSVACQKQSLMSSASDYLEYIHQDYLFHTTLASGTGNRFLLDLTERINTHSNRCLMLSSTLGVSFGPAIQEHTAIVDALEANEYDRAAEAMSHHLQQIKNRYLLQTGQPD